MAKFFKLILFTSGVIWSKKVIDRLPQDLEELHYTDDPIAKRVFWGIWLGTALVIWTMFRWLLPAKK